MLIGIDSNNRYISKPALAGSCKRVCTKKCIQGEGTTNAKFEVCWCVDSCHRILYVTVQCIFLL